MYIDTRSSSAMTEIEHYLKPMARQCINSRLDYRQISEIFKTVLVSIAESEFTIAGKSQTDSRISLLTGVHRKDVRRLLSQVQNKTLARQHGLITQIITVWLETPELIGKDGTPKPIPRHPQKGYATSFTELAETLTRDIHVRALWDECINSGVVSLTDDGMVHLLATNDYMANQNLLVKRKEAA
ncbi:DUF6502 family protein [Methylotenera sp. G11]|uniref:DUF6502 family protein n=1 Tax=Methylotenera sp. G11 TaxID=1506585 RepID=UPI00126A629D|nr:DUF6502 family protein [Methylotenera sp. G11]